MARFLGNTNTTEVHDTDQENPSTQRVEINNPQTFKWSSRNTLAFAFVCALGGTACTDETPQSRPHVEYRTTVWLSGLQEEVTVIKTPRFTTAQRADGQIVDFEELRASDRRVWRNRHGAASLLLVQRLDEAKPEEMIPVAVRFDLPGVGEIAMLPRKIRASSIAAAISNAAPSVAQDLARQGFVEQSRSRLMPALFGRMPARSLKDVVRDPRIVRVTLDEPIVPMGSGEYAAEDPIVEHSIDVTWNASPGNYGEGVGVGMIEWCAFDPNSGGGLPRGIYEEHIAFSHLTDFDSNATTPTIGYGNPPASCQSDADCDSSGVMDGCLLNPAPPGKPQVACLADRCVSVHASQVASVISASKTGGPSGAAKVKLYMSNEQKVNTAASYSYAYATMVGAQEQGVKLVNETHAFLTEGDGFQVADWYARIYGLQPVQSAGNIEEREACPKSSNAICVGAADVKPTTSVPFMTSYSAYLNPGGTDREEPDVTALGGEDSGAGTVKVIGMSSTTDWNGDVQGTSYSAPLVSNLLAHMLADCSGIDIDHPLAMRAVIRTAAWAGNPVAHKYETPLDPSWQFFIDHKDGAGWADAESLNWFCLGPGDDGGAGVIEVDLTGGEAPPDGTSEYTPGQPPPLEPQDYTPAEDLSFSRRMYVLAEANLNRLDRVRATISWFSCASGSTGAAESAPVDVDLDLFLYHVESDTYTYVYGSQSVNDNNEGFDTLVPDEGTYQLIYTRPTGTTSSCGSESIPMGWAARWGTPW